MDRTATITLWRSAKRLSAMLVASGVICGKDRDLKFRENLLSAEADVIIRAYNSLRAYREQLKPPSPRASNIKLAEEAVIRNALRETTQSLSSRMGWHFSVGGRAKATKEAGARTRSGIRGAGSIYMNVGYMWKRKVFNPLYAKGNLDASSWIVIQADEVRVNERNIRLYHGLAFNRTTGETKEAWIGQSRYGKQKADIAFTMRSAIDAARQIAAADVAGRLMGEKEDGKS